MKREIKFRAYCPLENKIFPVKAIDWSNNLCTVDEGDNTITDFIGMFEIIQFTGLKDKNSKEIYEGDIIEYYGGKRIVVFTPCDGLKLEIIYNEPVEGIRQTHENWTYNTIASSVIIGNIYKNPELLE